MAYKIPSLTLIFTIVHGFMKQKASLIICYAILILLGGIMGFVLAKSYVSLIVSSIFALLLFCCSLFIWRGGKKGAYSFAITLVLCLLLFFSYKFFLSFKIAPSGIMMLASASLLINLLLFKPSQLHQKNF